MNSFLSPFAAVVSMVVLGATETGRTSAPPSQARTAAKDYGIFPAQREAALLDVALVSNRMLVLSEHAQITLESALNAKNQPCLNHRSKLICRFRQGAFLLGRLTLTQETKDSTCVEVLAPSPLLVFYPKSMLFLLAGLSLALGLWVWRKRSIRWQRILSGLCVKCAYPLKGLQDKRCPECGTPFGSEFQNPKLPG